MVLRKAANVGVWIITVIVRILFLDCRDRGLQKIESVDDNERKMLQKLAHDIHRLLEAGLSNS